MPLKLYLDNCCFNRPFDDQTQACAIDANCDYFITTDDAIIKKMSASRLIKVRNPIEFINLTED